MVSRSRKPNRIIAFAFAKVKCNFVYFREDYYGDAMR